VQDVLTPPCLPDLAGEAVRVVAGDHAQLGQLLVQRPAADAVEPARPQHPLDLSPRQPGQQVDAAVGTLLTEGALGDSGPGACSLGSHSTSTRPPAPERCCFRRRPIVRGGYPTQTAARRVAAHRCAASLLRNPPRDSVEVAGVEESARHGCDSGGFQRHSGAGGSFACGQMAPGRMGHLEAPGHGPRPAPVASPGRAGCAWRRRAHQGGWLLRAARFIEISTYVLIVHAQPGFVKPIVISFRASENSLTTASCRPIMSQVRRLSRTRRSNGFSTRGSPVASLNADSLRPRQ